VRWAYIVVNLRILVVAERLLRLTGELVSGLLVDLVVVVYGMTPPSDDLDAAGSGQRAVP
jgi:hypothetical protein